MTLKLAYGKLKLPYGTLDVMTLSELMLLLEQHLADEREYFEMTAYAVATGYASARKGKMLKMFKDESKTVGHVTEEKKREDTDYLNSLFD